jgi:hypothetical protein
MTNLLGWSDTGVYQNALAMVTAGSNIKHFNRRNTGNHSDHDTDETTLLHFTYTLKCEFKMLNKDTDETMVLNFTYTLKCEFKS